MIVAESISYSYRDLPVLRGVDIEVKRGEILGIVGPNGAGKTTLLKILSGILKPTSGAVLINGTNIFSMENTKRAQVISVVPQNAQIPDEITVMDTVLVGRNPHLGIFQWESALDYKIAREALRLTGLEDLSARPVRELSGGERQRTIVAMALAQSCPVMLLDEPVTSLDLQHQYSIMDLVNQLVNDRVECAVVSIHDLSLAGQYCDRLVMLSDGMVLVEGCPKEVLTEENILMVYGINVSVIPHPQTGTPVVLGISGYLE